MSVKTRKTTRTRTRTNDPSFEDFELESNTHEYSKDITKIEAQHLLMTYFPEDETKGDKADIIKHWEAVSTKIDKFIICKEICPTTRSVHYHLFISACDGSRFKINGIKRLVVPGFKWPNVRHVDKRNINNCVVYCSKEDPEPLYRGYKPTKKKFNLNMDWEQFVKLIEPYISGQTITPELVKETAKQIGGIGSTTNLIKFQKQMMALFKGRESQRYVTVDDGYSNTMNVPSVVRMWMSAPKSKGGLIVRTNYPDEFYDMLKMFGPHILHTGYVDMDDFEPEKDKRDAKFVVFKQVGNFNSIRNQICEHSTYMEILLTGGGGFLYGERHLRNDLPVIYIEDSVNIGSIWEIHKKWIKRCSVIEIINFDKETYRDILGQADIVCNLNEEHSEFNSLVKADNIDDYVVNVHLNANFKRDNRIDIDLDVKRKKLRNKSIFKK